jgi:ankyrin repeat protein
MIKDLNYQQTMTFEVETPNGVEFVETNKNPKDIEEFLWDTPCLSDYDRSSCFLTSDDDVMWKLEPVPGLLALKELGDQPKTANIKLNMFIILTIKMKYNVIRDNPHKLYNDAILCNNLTIVKLLHEAGADHYSGKLSTLHMAVAMKNESIVTLLLELGVEQIINNKCDPLTLSLLREHYNIVKLLIPTGDKDKALMEASNLGIINIMELLLDSGANVDYQLKNGLTSLYMVAKNGHFDAVRLMLERPKPANIMLCDYQEQTPLMVAIQSGHTDIVKFIINHAYAYNISIDDLHKRNIIGCSPLGAAANYGNPKIVEILLENLVNNNVDKHIIHKETTKGMTPLSLACSNKHLGVVKVLVDHAIKENITITDMRESSNIILGTCKSGNVDIVNELLRHMTSEEVNWVNKHNVSSLYLACKYNHPEIVKLLIKAGIKDSATKRDGRTSLFIASYYGYTEIVELLLKHDICDVNKPDVDGWSPLYVAAWGGIRRCCKGFDLLWVKM